MHNQLTDLAAWRHAGSPIRIGEPARDAITLDDLSGAEGYRRVTAAMSGVDMAPRSRLLSPLHLANWTIIELLVRPCVHDGVWIAARPHQLGFRLDAAGGIPELWLARDVDVTGHPDAAAVGTVLGTLLAPVADVVAACSRIHERAVKTVAAESAIGHLHGSARAAGRIGPDDVDWLETASAALALALGAPEPDDRMRLRPDAGPEVVMPARSLCCVLHTKDACHGCPGCPVLGDRAERERSLTEWFAAMHDEEFLTMTGRRKQPHR